MRVRFWVLALALSLTAANVMAQVQGGTVIGTVKDDQGGVRPGVSVVLQGNGPSRTLVTEGDGAYRFLNVPPGTYTLTATLQGFRTVIREGVVVAVGQNVNMQLTM